MLICLLDVQDQICGYLVVIAHLLRGSNGVLVIIECLLLYWLRGATLGSGEV